MSSLSIAAYFPFMRVKITGHNAHGPEAGGSLVKFEPDRRYRPLCHVCGEAAATVHSCGHVRLIHDLNMADSRIWLQVEYRKIWCNNCQAAKVEQLSFVDAGQHVTHRLARYIHELCKFMNVKDVAEHLKLDARTVKRIDKEYLQWAFSGDDYEGVRILMIDEIAVRRGHNYMTVVADYFSGRVLWMGRARDIDTLDRFFKTMTDEQKAAIEAVAMDMWDAYINRVSFHCPQAKIVFDFFHVVQAFGRVIDKVRRLEFAKADAAGKNILKGSRYALLKNAENLTDRQRYRLEELLSVNETLSTLYILKDQLKLLYHYSDADRIQKAIDTWCEMAETIEYGAVKAFAKQLRRHAYGILNHADYPIGTSMLEGMNNKIKVIKRKAYGFHDDEYFILKVKQAFAARQTNQLFCS